MSKQYKFVKLVSEQDIWSHKSGAGKGRLGVDILKFLRSNHASECVDEEKIAREVAPTYKLSTVRVALYVLQSIGALESKGTNHTTFVDTDFLLEYPSVVTWLSELKDGRHNRKMSLLVMKHYLDFLKTRPGNKFENPEELLNDILDSKSLLRTMQAHVALIKEYVKSLKDVEEATRRKHYTTIRGFYYRNQCKLPESPLRAENHWSKELKKPNGSDGRGKSLKIFSALRKMLLIANPRDKAVILCMLQGGIDESTLAGPFNVLAYSQLTDALGEEFRKWDIASKAPVQISLFRPKSGRTFYTFLAEDALSALKDYLQVRFNQTGKDIQILPTQKQDAIPHSEPIFLTQAGKPIASTLAGDVFRNLAFKSGVTQREDVSRIAPGRGSKIRYAIHSHEVRDTLKSLGHSLGLKDECEFFLGHEIDRQKYDKSPEQYPEYWRDLYSKMKPFLNIISNDPEIVTTKEALRQALESKDTMTLRLAQSYRVLEQEILRLKEREKENEAVLAWAREQMSYSIRDGKTGAKVSPDEVEDLLLSGVREQYRREEKKQSEKTL